MKYVKFSKFDTANGNGIGTVIWCSGCSHRCPQCQNPETWDENAGQEFTEESMQELLDSISNPHVKRVTFSGGDPLYPSNRAAVLQIAQSLKECYPDKVIWLYTGYLYEQVSDLEVFKYIDVLVDGKFDINLKNIMLPYSGSENQRVIDVPMSIRSGTVVLWDK